MAKFVEQAAIVGFKSDTEVGRYFASQFVSKVKALADSLSSESAHALQKFEQFLSDSSLTRRDLREQTLSVRPYGMVECDKRWPQTN